MEIRNVSGPELNIMEELYMEAFPRSERKPFNLMKKKAANGDFELLSIVNDGVFSGLAIAMIYSDLVLLDYFAVVSKKRGSGIGSQALMMLKERYKDKRFFLEIELQDEHAANSLQRKKRREFYLRNGMVQTGIMVSIFGVPMEILTDGRPLTFAEYHKVYEKVMGPFFHLLVKKYNADKNI